MAAVPRQTKIAPHAPHARTGFGPWLMGWLGVVDHKKIGVLYLLSSLLFFGLGGIEALLVRLQLFHPNEHFVTATLYNQLFTMHGTTMIFFAIMPMLIGFINLVMPIMIGARDVAFPRLNALSFWLFLGGAIFTNLGWFLGGAPNAGWFSYTPISDSLYNPGSNIDWYSIGLQIAGVGTLLSGVNFLTTIFNMRTKGMTLMRMPLFVWTALVTSLLIALAFPALTVDLFLLSFDRLLGTQFFTASSGGAPLLWANLFWVFGHPEVYILVLPAFGVISEVVPAFSRKPLFGHTTMVGAVLVIGFLSFMVWVHHMFPLGYGPWVNSLFALTSMLIAVPTGVKIFNWLSTMWGGRLRFTAAMHYAAGFVVMFTIGGISGVMLAMAPADLQFNDSYFVVAHFHYVIIGGIFFAMVAAWHYWFPKLTGRLMNETMGKIGFWIQFVGFNLTFFPQHFLGLTGMPRRIFTYPAGNGWTWMNEMSTIGACTLGVGILLWLINMATSAAHGAKAPADPWNARTLEWSIPSPPPEYDFDHLPLVRGRDALWVEKDQGSGKMIPAPDDPHREKHGIHMPAPDATPALLALGMTVFGYGALYHEKWVMIAAAVVSLASLYHYMWRPEPQEVIPFEPEPEPSI